MNTSFLSARALLKATVMLAAFVVVACGGSTGSPPNVAVVPSPSVKAALPVPTVEPTIAAVDPTVEPTLEPTQELPTPTPTPAATPTLTPNPTAAPPVGISEIAFGNGYTETTNDAVLEDASDLFDGGKEVAWRVELPPAQGGETILVEVTDSNDDVVYSGEYHPAAGSNIFFGKAVMASTPGWYTMHFLLDESVIAEGTFKLRAVAAADPTPKPTPKATPKPTRKPSDPPKQNCDPSYPTLCLPSSPDIDCGEINAQDFPVRGRDPHGFDGDGDGVGCES